MNLSLICRGNCLCHVIWLVLYLYLYEMSVIWQCFVSPDQSASLYRTGCSRYVLLVSVNRTISLFRAVKALKKSLSRNLNRIRQMPCDKSCKGCNLTLHTYSAPVAVCCSPRDICLRHLLHPKSPPNSPLESITCRSYSETATRPKRHE